MSYFGNTGALKCFISNQNFVYQQAPLVNGSIPLTQFSANPTLPSNLITSNVTATNVLVGSNALQTPLIQALGGTNLVLRGTNITATDANGNNPVPIYPPQAPVFPTSVTFSNLTVTNQVDLPGTLTVGTLSGLNSVVGTGTSTAPTLSMSNVKFINNQPLYPVVDDDINNSLSIAATFNASGGGTQLNTDPTTSIPLLSFQIPSNGLYYNYSRYGRFLVTIDNLIFYFPNSSPGTNPNLLSGTLYLRDEGLNPVPGGLEVNFSCPTFGLQANNRAQVCGYQERINLKFVSNYNTTSFAGHTYTLMWSRNLNYSQNATAFFYGYGQPDSGQTTSLVKMPYLTITAFPATPSSWYNESSPTWYPTYGYAQYTTVGHDAPNWYWSQSDGQMEATPVLISNFTGTTGDRDGQTYNILGTIYH